MNGVQAHEVLPLDSLEREETFAQLRTVMEEMAKADREILTFRYALDYEPRDCGTAVHQPDSRSHATQPGSPALGRTTDSEGVGKLP